MLVKRFGLISERCVSSRTDSIGEEDGCGGGGGMSVGWFGMLEAACEEMKRRRLCIERATRCVPLKAMR